MAFSFELSSLNGTNGFVINGIDAGDWSGSSVSGAGDINGDGFDDVIIGAPFAAPNGKINAGESYVVFGKAGGFAASLDLSALNGGNGFVINGINRNDFSGISVSGAGDINGDGFADVIIGASFPSGVDAADESYVVFGKAGGFDANLDLSSLDGSNGFIIKGIYVNDDSGRTVRGAGDVNGDGFADVIIGAGGADPKGHENAGESYVVFGKAGGFDPTLDLASLNGANGFVMAGIHLGDHSGSSVSGAGDVNGDGLDDVIIGAYRASPVGKTAGGEAYVIFGMASEFEATLRLRFLDGINGFVLKSIDTSDALGSSVSAAGDINGDGFDDVIVSAPFADPNGRAFAGESYVVFGKAGGFDASLDLSSLDGTNGFIINGINANDLSGRSVSGAGDVNGDGYDDLIIGAHEADPNGKTWAGESYVVFGKAGGFDASLDLSSLDGTNGFVINGIDESDFSGSSVSGAGDINRDGFDDLIIGASYADPNGKSSAGESYVVFGRASFIPPTDGDDLLIGADGPNDSIDGLGGNDMIEGRGGDDRLIGGLGDDSLDGGVGVDTLAGGTGNDTYSITAADGDVIIENPGEGTADIVFSAISYTLPDNVEELTLTGTDNLSATGNELGNRLTGNEGNNAVSGLGGDDFLFGVGGDDTLDGGTGNDAVNGGDGNDVASGGNGDDTLRGGTGNDTLDGGAGNDSLEGNAGDDSANGRSGLDTLTGGAGNDSLVGGGGNDSVTGDTGNDTVSGGDGGDTVDGGAGDDSVLGGNGADQLFGGVGNDTLIGGLSADTLDGGVGDDTLFGNEGRDSLIGGAGNDTFRFTDLTDSPVSEFDIIAGFDGAGVSGGDVIVLGGIDADTTHAGNQAFTFIGTAFFSGTAGELRVSNSGDNTLVRGDVDGDGVADLQILIQDGTTIDASTYIADDFVL